MLKANKNTLVMSVAEAADVMGLSRSKMYQLAHSQGFPTIKVGGRMLISTKGLEQWIDKQAEKGWYM